MAITGELSTIIKEQSLMVAMVKGLVIVTRCAHPGAVNIVKKTMELTNMEVHLVLGGFPLGGASENKILSIIE